MRRFYVVPKSLFYEQLPGGDGGPHPYHDLFISCGGSHFINLGDSDMILLCCSAFGSEKDEDIWHAHPEVARLHHPVREAATPLVHLLTKPEHAHKQFRPKHLDALAKIGVTPNHTVWDVHEITTKINRSVRLREEY